MYFFVVVKFVQINVKWDDTLKCKKLIFKPKTEMHLIGLQFSEFNPLPVGSN